MASTYSTNLKIELQATGENSGTWGTITNTNLGTALEQAIVGYGNPNYASDANLTLTYTDTNAAQAARALVLNVTSTGSLSATRELIVPTIQKQYIVQNNTTGSQSITVKTSAGTGITVPNGRKAHLYVDGTNVIYMDDYVDINGGAIDGTPIGANSASTGAFSTLSASGNVTLSGGTANGVLYLNASKVATSGSALTYDGTTFGVDSAAVFNDSGANVDFRVEGDTDANLLFVDASQEGVGVGVPTTVLGKLNVSASTSLSLAEQTYTGDALLISAANITAGLNTYGSGITWSRLGTNGRRRAAISSVQTTADEDQVGLAFFTHPSTGLTVDIAESMRLDHNGNLGIGTSSPAGRVHSVPATVNAGLSAAFVTSQGGSGANTGSSIRLGYGTSAGAYAEIGGAYQDPGTYLTFRTNADNVSAPTERMRIDASGNLGLGVTPSAWNSGFRALQIGEQAALWASTTSAATWLTRNTFLNSSSQFKYIATDYANALQIDNDGAFKFYTAPSGTAGNTITFTQAMTLDASGNLGVGATSPAARVHISGANTAARGQLTVVGAASDDARITLYRDSTLHVGFAAGSSDSYIGTESNTPFRFLTNGSERARITAGGNVSIGGTADRGTTVGAAALNLFNGTAPAGTLTNGVSLYSSSGDLNFMDSGGSGYKVGYRNVPQSGSAKTTSYSLAVGDVGKFIEVGASGSITVPNSTFAAGDIVSIFNNTSGNVTLTMSITTAYIGGTDADKNTITLATRGVATILFISGTVCVVNGNVS